MRPVRRLLVPSLVSALTLACAPPASVPASAGRAPVVIAPPTDSFAPPWVIRHDGAMRTHDIRVVAELATSADAVDTALVTDTIMSELVASWSEASMSWPRRILGRVDQYRVGRHTDSLSTSADLPLPLSFSTSQAAPGAQPTFVAPDVAGCGIPGLSAVHGLRDLWLSLPDTLQPGAAWRDTSTYRFCRDGIPLLASVEREFHVLGARSSPLGLVVDVRRTSTGRIEGAGVQFGDSVRIEGVAAGEMTYELAASGARVLSGTGTSSLTLTLRGTRRTHRMTQRSRIEIRER